MEFRRVLFRSGCCTRRQARPCPPRIRLTGLAQVPENPHWTMLLRGWNAGRAASPLRAEHGETERQPCWQERPGDPARTLAPRREHSPPLYWLCCEDRKSVRVGKEWVRTCK